MEKGPQDNDDENGFNAMLQQSRDNSENMQNPSNYSNNEILNSIVDTTMVSTYVSEENNNVDESPKASSKTAPKLDNYIIK